MHTSMKEPPLPDKLTTVFFDLGRLIKERIMQHHTAPAISHARLMTLIVVGEMKAPSMHEVASKLRITSPSATTIINELVKSGELERIGDSTDRRMVRLRLTPQGQKTLKKSTTLANHVMGTMLQHLSEAEQKQLLLLLQTILKEER